MEQYSTIIDDVGKMSWMASPVGETSQTNGRYMQEPPNGYRSAISNTARKNGIPTLHREVSNSSLTAQRRTSGSQLVELAKEAMRNALEENKTQASDAGGIGNEIKAGVTIDLSHQSIQQLPDEVIDIIKNELER